VLNQRMMLQFIIIQWRFPRWKPLCFAWLCVTCLAEHHFVWLFNSLTVRTMFWATLVYVRVLVTKSTTSFGLSALSICCELLTSCVVFGPFISTRLCDPSEHSFLDLRFRVFIPNYHSIVNLHGCTLPMFDRHTGISCPWWWASSWQCSVLIGQFVLLAWRLTRPAIWLGGLLVLSLASTPQCIATIL
jgi:hypothetical protein